MKISELIKVDLNVFYWTCCGSFSDFSIRPDLQRAQDPRQIWSRSTPLKRDLCFMVSMRCYPSRTWMVSFKRPGICQNFCFYFKLSWKKEEHIAVCAHQHKIHHGSRATFSSGGHQLYLCRTSQALGCCRPQKNPKVTKSCWKSSSSLLKWANRDWSQLTDVNQEHF